MKVRALLVVFVAFACAAGACSLNPQPLPPGSYDASADVIKMGNDAASGGDAGVPPPEDAGDEGSTQVASDAGDASTDAEVDAEVDAATDAPDDAPDGD